MKENLIFFGNERIATGITSPVLLLQALLAAGYPVATVVIAQASTAKSRKERSLEIEAVAEAHGIPVIAPASLKDAKGDLAKFGATAGVLAAYGKIVPQEVIDTFPKGIINIHPSLLPKHRGPTPIESAILQGDKETGVSLMQLAAKMDGGPVYAQETVLLRGDETKQVLADQLVHLGANMLIQYLPDILSGKLQPTEQQDTHATYDKKIEKSEGAINWSKPALEIEREVRAYAGWPKSRATIATRDVVITKSHVVAGSGMPGTLWLDQPGQLGVYTNDGVLVIDSLIPSGKKEMTISDFLRGYPIM
jgi:methionyl-tRNA formyltransferase